MIRVAFYAPLKPPSHPVPSGERTIARNLMTMLRASGAEVTLMSELRSREGRGDAAEQAALITRAEAEIDRILSDPAPRPDLWLTYHNYYKAPDLIGPAVARAWGIPYLLIESTRAQKRLGGAWDRFARAAEAASDAADIAFHFTEHDGAALRRDSPEGQHVALLRPYLARTDLPPDAPRPAGAPMLTVGMFRRRDKLDSYRVLAEALALVTAPDWQLEIAGDGPVREEVEALMAPFGPRVRFLGQQTPETLQHSYARAGLFVWPGVNEGFGMVFLEAQAAGLPCIAQDRPGVRDVVHGPGLVPVADGPGGLARRVDSWLATPETCAAIGRKARATIARQHLQDSAARGFWAAAAQHLGISP